MGCWMRTEVKPTVSYAVGVDIGGTRCRALLVSRDGAPLARAACPTAASSADALVAAIKGLVDEVTEAARPHEWPQTVGIGLPGIVDQGVMRRAVNVECLEGIELAPFFAGALGRRVVIDTDVNAAAWGQWNRSRPDRSRARLLPARFAYVSIGTGVGAGVVLDGELVRHTHNGPGHWGHVVVDASTDAPRCRCGATGCIEAIVGGWTADGPGRSRRGDAAADRIAAGTAVPPPVLPVYGRQARALAACCLQLGSVYAVDVVALGGGVIDAHPDLVNDVRAAVESMRGSVAPAALSIERAALSSDEAGAWGAALLAMAHARRTTGQSGGD